MTLLCECTRHYASPQSWAVKPSLFSSSVCLLLWSYRPIAEPVVFRGKALSQLTAGRLWFNSDRSTAFKAISSLFVSLNFFCFFHLPPHFHRPNHPLFFMPFVSKLYKSEFFNVLRLFTYIFFFVFIAALHYETLPPAVSFLFLLSPTLVSFQVTSHLYIKYGLSLPGREMRASSLSANPCWNKHQTTQLLIWEKTSN